MGRRAGPGVSQSLTGVAAAAAPTSRLGSRDKVFFFSGFFWRWGGDSGGWGHPTNAGRGCSSPSNWRSQWEAAGPAALAARGRGGNLANLRSPGGSREGRSGTRRRAGKAGAGGGGGAAGPGAACRRGCAGPAGCASRSTTPSGTSQPPPRAVTVRIVTRPPGEGRRHQRGLGRAGGGVGAGGCGGERWHLARRPASLRETWRGRWGRCRRRAGVDPRPRLEEERGGRCQLGDHSS